MSMTKKEGLSDRALLACKPEHAYVSTSFLCIIGLFCTVYRALLACIPEPGEEAEDPEGSKETESLEAGHLLVCVNVCENMCVFVCVCVCVCVSGLDGGGP